jgi:protein tyrosine phosphatase
MLPDVKWVRSIEPFKIALMAKPRSGDWLEGEIAGLRDMKIGTVVSLIEQHEIRELQLTDEEKLCAANGIDFIHFPIADRGVPTSVEALKEMADGLSKKIRAGEAIVIHCRAGIGRTGLFAACVMLHLGYPFKNIFATLSKARGVNVPDTDSQIAWVQSYAKTVVIAA